MKFNLRILKKNKTLMYIIIQIEKKRRREIEKKIHHRLIVMTNIFEKALFCILWLLFAI